jgi:hypothetical protein
MRSPSARVLINRCDIYVSTPTTATDADGAPQFPIGSTPTYPAVPCTIQGRARVDVGEQRRVTQITDYVIIFANYIEVTPRDTLVFNDPLGVRRTCYIESVEDMAGRGAAFKVYAQERT